MKVGNKIPSYPGPPPIVATHDINIKCYNIAVLSHTNKLLPIYWAWISQPSLGAFRNSKLLPFLFIKWYFWIIIQSLLRYAHNRLTTTVFTQQKKIVLPINFLRLVIQIKSLNRVWTTWFMAFLPIGCTIKSFSL